MQLNLRQWLHIQPFHLPSFILTDRRVIRMARDSAATCPGAGEDEGGTSVSRSWILTGLSGEESFGEQAQVP